jgi:hypothetical protein
MNDYVVVVVVVVVDLEDEIKVIEMNDLLLYHHFVLYV